MQVAGAAEQSPPDTTANPGTSGFNSRAGSVAGTPQAESKAVFTSHAALVACLAAVEGFRPADAVVSTLRRGAAPGAPPSDHRERYAPLRLASSRPPNQNLILIRPRRQVKNAFDR